MNVQRVWRQIIVLLISVGFICTAILVFSSGTAKAQDDYTFGSENVNKGTSTNPTGKDTEDGTFETLSEGDQYANTNFSGSSENIVTGTGGGAAFPGALDTDDASRRTYTEASSGGSPTYQIIRPNADGTSITMTTYPASPTTHYTKVSEVAKDDETSYNAGVLTGGGEKDIYGMTDPSDPGGTPNIDVTMWIYARGVTATQCSLTYGLYIGTSSYVGATPLITTTTYTNYSYTWTLNPSTSAEWAFAELASLSTYLLGVDGNPDTHTTQVALLITFTPTASYTLDAQITYSSVTSTSQTTGFQIICQGYRNGDTENVYVQAWNYTSSAWVTKITISAGSDTDYNFNLLGWAANCERSSGNVILLRLVDASNGDATQTVAYLDVLKVNRIELGYALDVVISATAVAQYGNITLRIKGYTSAETFKVNVWNYTSSAYDSNKLSITSLSNAWQTTIDLCDDHHRSGTTVKIQFVDGTASTSDFVQDTLYLDVVWVTRYHTAPTITLYGATPTEVNLGMSITFWCTYSDYDNEDPTYVYAHIGASDYSMTGNNSGDTLYYDGKLYGLVKSDIPAGNITYYFKVKDANSIDVTTSPVALSVNTKPTLTLDGVTPSGGNPGTYTFFVTYTDADSNSPQYVKATIGGSDYTMTYNGSGGGYHYDKAMSGGTTAYSFKTEDYRSGVVSTTPKNLIVNYLPSLSGFGRAPGDPVYVTTELNFTMTFTDLDNTMPSSIKWREDGGATQNVTMVEIDPSDTTTSDGKAYYLLKYLTHGVHNYDFGASDSLYWTSGGSNSVTIANRAPTIDNKFVDDHEWRNTYWEYDYAYTDLDGDTVVFQLSTNASFLNINSASGLVYGTTSDPVGWYSITVWCNDSYSGSDSDSFVLYVDNREPVITNGPGSHVDQWRNQVWYYDFDFSDADGDSMAWARSGPTWLTIASDGNLSGTTSDAPGLYSFTVYANDSHTGSDSYSFDIHITNRVPAISSIGNASQQEATYLAYHILASDDDGDSLSYALSTNASAWASISGAWVNGTAAGIGWYEFTVWANDSYGGSDFEHWHLTVAALPSNDPPYFTSTPIYSVANNSAYYYDANATDPDAPPDPITYGLETDCPNLGINPSSGVVSGIPDQVGIYYANVTADDGTNPPAYQNYSITVTTTAPSFSSSPTFTGTNNTAYSYHAQATDPESETLTFDLGPFTNASFLIIGPSTGMITGTPTTVGWYYVNVTVTDGVYTVWQNYTLTVSEQAPPGPAGPTGPIQISMGVVLMGVVLVMAGMIVWKYV